MAKPNELPAIAREAREEPAAAVPERYDPPPPADDDYPELPL